VFTWNITYNRHNTYNQSIRQNRKTHHWHVQNNIAARHTYWIYYTDCTWTHIRTAIRHSEITQVQGVTTNSTRSQSRQQFRNTLFAVADKYRVHNIIQQIRRHSRLRTCTNNSTNRYMLELSTTDRQAHMHEAHQDRHHIQVFVHYDMSTNSIHLSDTFIAMSALDLVHNTSVALYTQ
jgi:hypothetical protein